MKQLLNMIAQYNADNKKNYGFVLEKFSIDIQFINERIN